MRMKLWMFMWILLSVTITVQAQQAVYSIAIEKGSLEAAVTALRNVTGAVIAYNKDDIAGMNVPALSFNRNTIAAILQKLLSGSQLEVQQKGAVYVIIKKQARKITEPVLQAVTGSISGKLVDFETADPLPGATVQLPALKKGMITNEKGNFQLEQLPEGEYAISITYTGYQPVQMGNIQVSAGKQTTVEVKMLPDKAQLTTVVIKGGRKSFGRVINSTDAQLITEVKSARTVSSGVSNEQIVRSTDRDAGEVARRITGVSVVDNRQLIIRGLSPRYNVTFLNDVMAPSTEQDSRSFSLDLIPSNLIDKMLVYKSPAPDLPGDFAGGVLKISTRNAMPVKQWDVQLSAQYRPGVSFSDVNTYRGGKYDLLGFDDGTRKLPKGFPDALQLSLMPANERTAYARSLPNIWQAVSRHHTLDTRSVINYYNSWRIGKNSQLGNLTTFTYTRTMERNIMERQWGNTQEIAEQGEDNKTYLRKYGAISNSIEDQTREQVRIGFLQNSTLTLRDSGTISFKNFFNQMGADITSIDVGAIAEALDTENKKMRLYYRQRMLYSGQLSGSHYLSVVRKSPLRWGIGYARTDQQEPDNRMLLFTRLYDPAVAPFAENPLSGWRMALSDGAQYYDYNLRSYASTVENSYTGYFDYEHHLQHSPVLIRIGTYNEFKERSFYSRELQIIYGPAVSSGLDTKIDRYAPPEVIYAPENFREDGSGFEIQERSNSRYQASNQLNAGYAGLVIPLCQKLEVYTGARVEYYHFKLAAAGRSGYSLVYPIDVNKPQTFLLPSVNLKYNIRPQMLLRAAYGKTINRPEFREMAPFGYFNNLTGIYEYGNPALKTATFDNYDLRWEFYPLSRLQNEMINAGLFYKYAKDPIEAFTINDKNSQAGNQLLFKNSEHAYVYGAEAEIRKNLDFLGGRFFDRLSVMLNGSYIATEVFTPGQQPGPFSLGNSDKGNRKRPLQGQSKWLLNGALNYENIATGTKASLNYTWRSDRIAVVGNNDLAGDGIYTEGSDGESGFADIMEKGRNVLDIALLQRITKWLQIKFSVQDLLNQPVLLYEDWNRNYRYDKEQSGKGDNIFLRYKPASYYSLSFNFSLY